MKKTPNVQRPTPNVQCREEALAAPVLKQKLAAAKKIYADIIAAEASLFETRDRMLVRAWQLGEILSELKEEIGHGKWLFWLGGNWPDLGERNAQRCMQFYKSNDQIRGIPRICAESDKKTEPNKKLKFDVDATRKFMWGYIPAKERPELEGDVKDDPTPHHLTFVNHFEKFDRQVRSGQMLLPSQEVIRRDLERPLLRMVELVGRDWFLEKLGE